MLSEVKSAISFCRKLLNSWMNDGYNKVNLCNRYSFLSYNKSTKLFSINNSSLDQYDLVNIRRTIMTELKRIIPQSYINIDEIITGYYDQCLERYLYGRLNRSFNNEDTCWRKYAQNNKCCGWQEPKEPFDEKRKIEFYNKFCELYPTKNVNKRMINSLFRDDLGYVYGLSNHISKKDDKILSLYHNIKNSGFSNLVSAFTSSPIILDFSLIKKKYNVTSGRHRIAVLRYLRSQGKIRNIKVKCHIIEHSYESLIYTRPYTESCKKCNWGEIYDPGKGTHQDFFIREGIAFMRGHPRKKGGTQKWNLISPIFKQMVENKTILDVGGHRGLYCFKALEYGSKEATLFDSGEHHISNFMKVKERYSLEDLLAFHGDFYDVENYKKLYNKKYDTVFLFGIIHHLLRLGIQNNILTSFDELVRRIYDITNYGVIIEFAMPWERDFLLRELKEYKNNFKIEEFERSLKNYFPNYQNLGKCEYISGNRFGRFMFCATK